MNRISGAGVSPTRRSSAVIFAFILLLGVFVTAPDAVAGRFWTPSEEKPKDGPPGNLAIVGFDLFEVGSPGVYHKVLARIKVENQSPLSLESPWTVNLLPDQARGDEDPALGVCKGELLPRGQIALCDMWLDGYAIEQGQTVIAALDRDVESFDQWDGDPTDDARGAIMRTRSGARDALRIASWNVRPRILHGMGEIQFDFTVEGGHLVWVSSGESDQPRLVAGHPADGLLSGKGTLRIRESGPITIIARNSLGGFVYAAIPVLNSYEEPTPHWGTQAAVANVDGYVTPRILEPGVYEDDDNDIVLQSIRNYLEDKDWSMALQQIRELDMQGAEPRPASALNPRAR